MSNQKTYTMFLERMAKHNATPPPRHFGQNLLDNPLTNESESIIKGFSVSNQSGLLALRINVRNTEGKFWINGLITRITLHNDSLQLVYFDTAGHHYINIPLKDLAEMAEYQPRDGTCILIENEKLVIKSKNIKRQDREEKNHRATNNLTTPTISKTDLSAVQPISTNLR